MWLKYPAQNPETPARTIEGEAVVITPDDSLLHSLNLTATFIWERSDGNQTLESIYSQMSETYEVAEEELRADILEFVHEAEQKGMLQIFPEPHPVEI